MATKRTYQPKKKKTLRKLGFRARKSTVGGRRIIKRRIAKGRKRITVSDDFRALDKKPRNRAR